MKDNQSIPNDCSCIPPSLFLQVCVQERKKNYFLYSRKVNSLESPICIYLFQIIRELFPPERS